MSEHIHKYAIRIHTSTFTHTHIAHTRP